MTITLEIRHTLGIEEAKARLTKYISDAQRFQKEVEWSWAGNVLTGAFLVHGIKASGDVTVYEDRITVDSDELPWYVNMVRRRVESRIREIMNDALFGN